MGRPPVKSEMAMTRARLVAQAKFLRTPIGREVWLRSQVEKLIDKIDPLELVEVFATTFIIYDLIKSTPPLLAKAWEADIALATWLTSRIGVIDLSPIIKILFGNGTLSDEQWRQLNEVRNTPDFSLLIKSFALAYMLVKHSGQIINGVGNITKFVAGALGSEAILAV